MQFECVKELSSQWEADPKIPLQFNRDTSFKLHNESFDENVLFTLWDAALRGETDNTDGSGGNVLALTTACRSEMEVADKEYQTLLKELNKNKSGNSSSSSGNDQQYPFVSRAIIRTLAMRCVVKAIFKAVSDNVSLVGEELYRSVLRKVVSTWGGKPDDYILQYSIPTAIQQEIISATISSTTKSNNSRKPVQQCKVVVGDGIGMCAWLCVLLRFTDLLLRTLQASHDEEVTESTTIVGKALLIVRMATALNPESGRTLYELRVKRRSNDVAIRSSSREKAACVQTLDHAVAECLWGVNSPGNKMDFERSILSKIGANDDRVSYITLQHSESGAMAVFPFLAAWDSDQTMVSWGQLVVQASQIWGISRPYFKVEGETCITTPAEFYLWKKSPKGRCNLVVFEHFCVGKSSDSSPSPATPSTKLTGSLLADAARYGPYISSNSAQDDDDDTPLAATDATSSSPNSKLTTSKIGHSQKTKEMDFFLSTKLNYPNGTKTYTQRQLDVGVSSADLAAKNRAKLQALLAEERKEDEAAAHHHHDNAHEENGNCTPSDTQDSSASPSNATATAPVDDHLSKIYARMAPEVKKAGISMLQSPFKHSAATTITPRDDGNGVSNSGGGMMENDEDIAQECDRILKDLYRRRKAAPSSHQPTDSKPLGTEAQQHLRRLVRLS